VIVNKVYGATPTASTIKASDFPLAFLLAIKFKWGRTGGNWQLLTIFFKKYRFSIFYVI
jgi:hypothetical protein